ncbi:unnamed protein product [Bursaphelenchus xylophilus]|uniref:(pine wood nematode) hypothetical protein n=1 Tax=Bursaphelenchus xylophilus TaxID=6326 RepID=A0A1I7RYB7_BURXY|nr:unnamed protein product [Bursaphelenchus xylophilus]CAG9085558.1 unnamed protein product [Bursaphelenchus xylophilus]
MHKKLTFYADPPEEELGQHELYELLDERFMILTKLENLRLGDKMMGKDFIEKFKKEIMPIQPLFFHACSSNKMEYYARRDMISHFLLRLVCSQKPEKQSWFVEQECALLKIRIMENGAGALKEDYFSRCQIPPIECDAKERMELVSDLVLGGTLESETDKREVYKIFFADCPDLVGQRKVLLKDGFCFATDEDLVNGIVQKFRVMLNRTMALKKREKEVESDDWIIYKMYKHLYPETSTGMEDNSANLKPEQIESMAHTSFPLCMRDMHDFLVKNRRLKNDGRLQFTRFLMGAGLNLEDSLSYFRNVYDANKYKELQYDITYNFRGSSSNNNKKKPYNCEYIVNKGKPPQDGCSGCPFQYLEEQELSDKLLGLRVSRDRIPEILSFKKDFRYDIACTRYFEATHKLPPEGLGQIITHPNEYFKKSVDYRREKNL